MSAGTPTTWNVGCECGYTVEGLPLVQANRLAFQHDGPGHLVGTYPDASPVGSSDAGPDGVRSGAVPGDTTPTAPISDEAMAAFRSAPGCWALGGETLRAGLAAARPLLVSAEAERRDEFPEHLIAQRDEAQAHLAEAEREIEGLRAELAERDAEFIKLRSDWAIVTALLVEAREALAASAKDAAKAEVEQYVQAFADHDQQEHPSDAEVRAYWDEHAKHTSPDSATAEWEAVRAGLRAAARPRDHDGLRQKLHDIADAIDGGYAVRGSEIRAALAAAPVGGPAQPSDAAAYLAECQTCRTLREPDPEYPIPRGAASRAMRCGTCEEIRWHRRSNVVRPAAPVGGQAEPSDADVRAYWDEHAKHTNPDFAAAEWEAVRAGLRAAAAVMCCEAGRVAYPSPCPWHSAAVST